VPRLCEFYPGICLKTEGKTRKNLSQGKGRHVSVIFIRYGPKMNFTKSFQFTRTNTKLQENIFSGSQDVPRTLTDGRTRRRSESPFVNRLTNRSQCKP